jgi:pimeloyl-ACP methyl ester carboxylesterase
LAATYPEAAGKLVLTGAAGLIPKRTLKYYGKTWSYKLLKKIASFRIAGKIGERLKEKLKARAGSSDYRALPDSMKGTFVKVVNQDLKPVLKKVKSPTLLIFGDQDKETPVYFGKIMEKEIPDAGLVILEGAGHFAYLERSGDFVRIAKFFLKGDSE